MTPHHQANRIRIDGLSTRSRGVDPASIAQAAAAKSKQRQATAAGSIVIGAFFIEHDEIVLRAIAMQPAWNIDTAATTADITQMARWRTRQGAHQWIAANPTALRPINLKRFATAPPPSRHLQLH